MRISSGVFAAMLSTNCEKHIRIVVIQYERNSISTGPTVMGLSEASGIHSDLRT